MTLRRNMRRGLKNQIITEFDKNIIAGTHKDWVEAVIEGSDGQIEVLPIKLLTNSKNLKRKEDI